MVMMNSIVAVLCMAVAALADPLPEHTQTIVNEKGAQYKLYKEYTTGIELPKNAHVDVHKGLNIEHSSKEIDKKDLDMFYWHADNKFAIEKFFNEIDDKKDKKVMEGELVNDLKEKKPIKVALIECSYLLAPGLRQSCYADQLVTYTALCLQEDDVKSFYDSLDTDKKGGITIEEVEAIQHSKNEDHQITAEELGAYDGNGVSLDKMRDYLTQESVNDDFRVCRKGKPDVATGNVDFKNDCLLEELVEYTNDDLTEMDISVLFRTFDKDNNKKITKEEVANALPGADTGAVMKLLDMSSTTPKGAEPVVDYGEFRTYLRSPTVMMQLERGCTEPQKTQIKELECMWKMLKDLLRENHDTIWLTVPDMDQVNVFEEMDSSDDGKIGKDELKKLKNFNHDQTVARFIEETDADNTETICLEEFNEYLDIPHMVYGTGDCMLHSRKQPAARGGCFTDEVGDIIDNFKFFDDEAFESWFDYYDTEDNKLIDKSDALKDKLGDERLVPIFLTELGQGGEEINPFEFQWYVKQKELADRYDAEGVATEVTKELGDEKIGKLNAVLMKYIDDDITQYDIEKTFDRLDTPHSGRQDHELTSADFDPKIWGKMEALLKKIDEVDPDGDEGVTVNYREFWMWMHSKNTGQDAATRPLVKDIFEQECTVPQKTQEAELDCYTNLFKEVDKFM